MKSKLQRTTTLLTLGILAMPIIIDLPSVPKVVNAATPDSKATTVTASGKWGTAPWELTSDGTLTIHAGTGSDTKNDESPWNTYLENITKIVIDGTLVAPEDCSCLFMNLTNLTIIDGLNNLDTSNATSMRFMFYGSKLNTLDVSGFDTKKVTTMQSMFGGMVNLTRLNLSNFNTSNVFTMEAMFLGDKKLMDLDVSNFDTRKINIMGGMFSGLSSLTTLDLSSFIIRNENVLNQTFDASGLKNIIVSPGFPVNKIPKSIVVTVATNQLEVNIHDSSLYVGDKWVAQDNFDSAKDKSGKNVPFDKITVLGIVNTSKVGTYEIFYKYDGLEKKATVKVVANQKELKVRDNTLTVGDKWTAKDNFVSAKDKTGKALSFSDMKVTGTVNTSKVGTYKVTYTYDGFSTVATIIVKSKPVTSPSQPNTIYNAVYRLYNKNTGEHFYTTSAFERSSLIKGGWNDEGTGWKAPNKGTAVYRVYNPNAKGGDHYYTASKFEAESLVKTGWKWDNGGKPVLYSGGKTPVYVAFNPNATASGSHNYTTSTFEQQSLLKNGWKYGKVQFYGK